MQAAWTRPRGALSLALAGSRLSTAWGRDEGYFGGDGMAFR